MGISREINNATIVPIEDQASKTSKNTKTGCQNQSGRTAENHHNATDATIYRALATTMTPLMRIANAAYAKLRSNDPDFSTAYPYFPLLHIIIFFDRVNDPVPIKYKYTPQATREP